MLYNRKTAWAFLISLKQTFNVMNLQAWKVFNGTPWYYLLLPVPLESMN